MAVGGDHPPPVIGATPGARPPAVRDPGPAAIVLPGAPARAQGSDSGLGGGTVTTDLWPHGLTAEGRATRLCAVPPGATLAALVAREWPGPHGALTVAVDGRPVSRAAWAQTPLRGGEIVTLRTLLGDDGGRDKNPLAIVAQLAVVVAAVYFPPLITANLFLQAAIAAAITVGGTLVVNQLFPPRDPDPAPQPDGPGRPDPLYSLAGGANRARPHQPLLLVLGAHRVFPDLGTRAFTEYRGGDQYLYQTFHFGLGALEIDDLRIGTTRLAAYEDVRTEWGGADGRITFFGRNVDTQTGAELVTTGWVERITSPDTFRIGIDLTGRIFRVDDDGDIARQGVPVEVEWSAPGVAPVKRRLTLSSRSQTPYRRTLWYSLGAARTWRVRVRRAAVAPTGDNIYAELAWTALRSYQTDDADYTGQTRLGVRIRASGQLSGRLDRLSAMVRQKVPTWDGAQ